MLDERRFCTIYAMNNKVKFEIMVELANIAENLSTYDPKAQWRYYNQDLELENKSLISYENWYETQEAQDYCKQFDDLESRRNQILLENPEISKDDIDSFMDLYWWNGCDLNEVPENWFYEVKAKTAENAKEDIEKGII